MSTPRDLANRMVSRSAGGGGDGWHRETSTLPREQARLKAKEQFRQFPITAYMTTIESWRLLPGGEIEFTMAG